MGREGSSAFSQDTATGHYPELLVISPDHETLFLETTS